MPTLRGSPGREGSRSDGGCSAYLDLLVSARYTSAADLWAPVESYGPHRVTLLIQLAVTAGAVSPMTT